MFHHGWEYFTRGWKIVAIVSIILNYFVMISDLAELNARDWNPVAAVSVFINYCRLLYFAKFFESTAYLTKMITQITLDSRYFALVFFMSVVAFANVFWIIEDKEERFTGGNIAKAFIYSYRTSLGDWDTDAFEEGYEVLIYIMWLLSTVFTLIILLNMLIAIMGDTFGKIQETALSNGFKELCVIMAENEVFINRKYIFGKNKYIFTISSEGVDTGNEVWEGNFKEIKHKVQLMLDSHKYHLKDVQINLKNFTESLFNNKLDKLGQKVRLSLRFLKLLKF